MNISPTPVHSKNPMENLQNSFDGELIKLDALNNCTKMAEYRFRKNKNLNHDHGPFQNKRRSRPNVSA